MNTTDETGQESRGFEFPGEFEITAMGSAGEEADLKARVPRLLEAAGLVVLHESVRHRHSREGAYVAVTVGFRCESREDYETAHKVLRADPHVRYTL
jgi:putative lipoic acid-binding regulatory protein